MRPDAIVLEERRVCHVSEIDDYQSCHERHRVFPGVFENRDHKTILDVAAGVGIAGKRIQDNYPGKIICNDISPSCLDVMSKEGLETTSFDIDTEGRFPYDSGTFDAIIALATIEHVIHIDNFVKEIYRILQDSGYLYISAPNYSGVTYLLPFLFKGTTFHDPMTEDGKYEFYAHVRYFTYRSLREFVESFGFSLNAVYLPLPSGSTRFTRLKERSRYKAYLFRVAMHLIYRFAGARWASEPVLCFQKSNTEMNHFRKVIL